MGLASALYSSTAGLSTLGSAMQIIGDNLANVNTVGFKGGNFTFQDLMSQNLATMSGLSQVGKGTGLGDVYSSFEQGSFESTSSRTDASISGEGFFAVNDSETDETYYTRAGNFKFDNQGYLINPEGYRVQGYEYTNGVDDASSESDIMLTTYVSPPEETTKIQVITNLNVEGDDNSSGADNSLAAAWDGTQTTPLSGTDFEHQVNLKAYDSLGGDHDITIYFDLANTASAYEFIVTCNPSEDLRTGVDASTDSWAGLLGRGLLEFQTGGGVTTSSIQDIDFWRIDPSDGSDDQQLENADLSSDGYFTFTPTFVAGDAMDVKLDFGSSYNSTDTEWVNDSLTTTHYARISATNFQSANGAQAGDYQEVIIDEEGVMTGVYSNGQLIPLWRLALAKFPNKYGLSKEGGNLFSATKESDEAIVSRASTNGTGTIVPNALEQSNVDMATEFVKMITTQRGFQANSKIITVTDQMMAELIQLKR